MPRLPLFLRGFEVETLPVPELLVASLRIAAPLCWDDKAAPSHIARHGKPSSSSVKAPQSSAKSEEKGITGNASAKLLGTFTFAWPAGAGGHLLRHDENGAQLLHCQAAAAPYSLVEVSIKTGAWAV